MALSLINVGTTANDGTGDPLRTAFQTVNTAITAVNDAIVVGTGKTTFKDDSGSVGVTVLTSGFVGVANTTPTSPLHVSASGGSGVPALLVSDTSFSSAAPVIRVDGWRQDNNSSQIFAGGIALTRYNPNAAISNAITLGNIYFGGNHTNGTATNMVYGASISAAAEGTFNSAADAPTALVFRGGVTGGQANLTTANATIGTEFARIASNGDFIWKNGGLTTGMTWDASANSNAGGLGIGTTAPLGNLSVLGEGRLVTIGDSGLSNTPVIKSTNAEGSSYAFLSYDAYDHKFKVSGTEVLRIANTGDTLFYNAGATIGMTWDASANSNAGGLGIGTATPLAPLHVVGRAAFGSKTPFTSTTGATFTAASSYSPGLEVRNYDAAGWARLDVRHDSASGEFLVYQDAAGGVFFRNNSGASTLMQWMQGTAVLMTLNATGELGIGTSSPTAQVDLSGDKIRIRTAKTPASASATGNAGDICWDANYIYVCTATNTWKRSAIATW